MLTTGMVSVVAAVAVSRQIGRAALVDGLFEPRAESSILVRWNGDGSPSVSVLGPLTVARRKSFAPPTRALQLFIRPGHARRVFGMAVTELADRVVPLGQVWGSRGDRLLEQLSGVDPRRAVDVLAAELARRSADEVPAIGDALLRLRRGDNISSVAAALAIGERQLRRLFAAELGVSPQRIARIARLARVLRDDRGDTPWAEYALDHGYCDQSHMIREFQELLQTTPEQYLTSRRNARRGLAWAVSAP
jgi:AraC-like DNA-binding protein